MNTLTTSTAHEVSSTGVARMSGEHGSNPAGWTATAVAMVGFVIGGVALLLSPVNMTLFWIGAVLAVAGLPVFLVMNKMGLGDAPH